MAVELVIRGTCLLLDGAVDPLYIWEVLDLGNGVETNLYEVQFSVGWFKLLVHMHILDAEAVIVAVHLNLFERFNHRLGAMVLGN